MKIYVLSSENIREGSDTICVSQDIQKIQKSICDYLDPNADYPKLEIWEDGNRCFIVKGHRVLHVVANEMKITSDSH